MVKGPDGEMVEKEEANYKVTGALGKDKNTGVMYNGVLLKVGFECGFMHLCICSFVNGSGVSLPMPLSPI